MKKKIIACVYLIMLIVCIKLAFSYIYNECLIDKYNDNDYSSDTDPLLFCNWVQPYLAHYNMGNIHYQNKEYDYAIEEYQTALDLNPSQERECSVRINLALAMIKTLGEDYANEEKLEASIAKLKEARGILLEDGCATDDGDGHNETAEQLKREIDQLIDELEKKQQTTFNGGNAPQDNPDEKKDDDTYEQDIKKKLQQQQIDSYRERTESQQNYKEWNNEMNFDADGRVW
ncbi:MAG: tetratricopeptide repeat protein [Lachnospiraceae bacterium]|nr:tetratricopeptide repeat protein [Lachnospiraceae bacterium]